MSLAKTTVTEGVTTVGGLLPADMLTRITDGKDVPGSAPADYRLFAKHETVRDAAERSWAYLRGVWQAYQDQLASAGALDNDGIPATGLTRDRWLLVLFEELKFGRLATTPAGGLSSADGEKQFPVSHVWNHVPVHLVGWNTDLDHRTPGVTAAAPQSMVQEYLNRSGPDTLWGVLSNGRLLRLLRDSTSMVGAAYVEFDLQAVFDDDRFADFLLLWRLAHQSRFEKRAPGEEDAASASPASCWLEKWRTEAVESGTRALDQLRKGVEAALTTLGTGFLQHPDNRELRDRLGTPDLPTKRMHRALLRTAYRLLFLFVAEDRDVLIPTDTEPAARTRYEDYFSSARLRRTAGRRRGGPHGDQWQALRLVLDGLGREGGLPQLGLPGLGGIFEHTETDSALDGCELANEALSDAIRSLSIITDPKVGRRRTIDFRHLGAEELGSVYESLLELIPRHDPAARTFELRKLAGNERKTTGSYYTPSSLIECLLDSALDPVIDDAVKSGSTPQEQERALLRLTVCDPACGSGHFLVAAARRIAKRLAFVRTDDPEPSAEAVRTALRDVIGRCIYGVDLNPMAVELAKVSLWIEAVDPGKALTFLDAHIKHGNALIGTTPKLLAAGLPDDAFKPIEGDDKKWVTGLKKRNKQEREAWQDSLKHGAVQGELFGQTSLSASNAGLAAKATQITAATNDTLEAVHAQSDRYRALTHDADYINARDLADAWCAAFVWVKDRGAPQAVTTRTLVDLHNDPTSVPKPVSDEVLRLQDDYRFFHWHLEFPEVFSVPDANDGAVPDVDDRTGWSGGFSCVLGNPPWETVEFQETEFFAPRRPEIAEAGTQAERQRMVAKLAHSDELADRALFAEYSQARRESAALAHIARGSGRYPLAARGKLNTYPLFAEKAYTAIASHGYFGLVLPTGISTDATNAPFFSDLVRSTRLVSFLDFENEAYILSKEVHHGVRFCLLTAAGRSCRVPKASFAFSTRYMTDLPSRRFLMPPEEVLLVNPNTGTLPVFRSRRDAEIVLAMYRRMPVLIKRLSANEQENAWGASLGQLFNMATSSGMFRTKEALTQEGWHAEGNHYTKDGQLMLPLYEAKMFYHFDHRLGTHEDQTRAQANMGTLPRLSREAKDSPHTPAMPRYWVPEFDTLTSASTRNSKKANRVGVSTRLKEKDWHHNWLISFRKISNASNERTLCPALLPKVGLGDSANIILPKDAERSLSLIAVLSSFALDYVLRQKMAGTNINYFQFEQLPVPAPSSFDIEAPNGTESLNRWLSKRTIELIFTSHEMSEAAFDFGFHGPPFRWNEHRRNMLRCEIEAAIFYLYGINREDVSYIMETFPIVKRKDVDAHGSYRTKELVLEAYDQIAEAKRNGTEFETTLNPPPGEGPRHASPPAAQRGV